MKVRTSHLAILGITALVAVEGCSSASTSSGNGSAADSVGSVKKELVGTWTDASYTSDGAPFQSITLGSDGSFNWTAPCVSNGAATCSSISTDQGTWVVGKSGPQLGAPGGAQQLQLTDQFNQETSYFLTVSSGTFTLSTVFAPGASGYTFQESSPGETDQPTCRTITCQSGYECQTTASGGGQCVPIADAGESDGGETDQPTCLTITCQSGYQCQPTASGGGQCEPIDAGE